MFQIRTEQKKTRQTIVTAREPLAANLLSAGKSRRRRGLAVALTTLFLVPLTTGAQELVGDSDDWIGADLGIGRVPMQEAGPVFFVERDPRSSWDELERDPEPIPTRVTPHDPEPETAIVLRAVDVRGRRAYDVKLAGEELGFLGAYARRLGLTTGRVGVDGEVGDPSIEQRDPQGDQGGGFTKGWSGNHDSRILRTNTTVYPYRTIGTLYDGSGDCTGSLVGPRHVLTAAHCIYSRKNASWSIAKFKPGRNGTNSAPYGAANPIWYWVPQQYIDEPGGGGAVNRWDIAIIILDRTFNSWMGYASWSGNVLNNKVLYMRGYPRCDTEGEPVGCQSKMLWGDTKRCETGQYFNPDPNGWNYEIKTNCDGSDGQSGSSFYYWSGSNVYTTGVFSQHYCLGGCPGNANSAWPNVMTRITPTYMNIISWFRAAYP